jgi:hypothetical protein
MLSILRDLRPGGCHDKDDFNKATPIAASGSSDRGKLAFCDLPSWAN